nr:hypothetical protein [uncultured Lichenicoccus sp.]
MGLGFRRRLVVLLLAGSAGGRARAVDLHVIVAKSTHAALLRLASASEHAHGDRIDIESGLSGGRGLTAFPPGSRTACRTTCW